MDRAITSALDIWNRFTLTRYLAASVVALAFDVAVFSTLLAVGIGAAIASAVGYCAGIVIHWLVSSNFVFTGKTRDGAALHWQRAMFAASAFLGLAITVGTVAMFSNLGTHPVAAKAIAIIISFVAVYAARKWGVFK
jgi:putative flippase GtrA